MLSIICENNFSNLELEIEKINFFCSNACFTFDQQTFCSLFKVRRVMGALIMTQQWASAPSCLLCYPTTSIEHTETSFRLSRDSNPALLDHESSALTTRPRLSILAQPIIILTVFELISKLSIASRSVFGSAMFKSDSLSRTSGEKGTRNSVKNNWS